MRPARMKSLGSIKTILQKELREFVRDRRTLMLALVLGPLLTPAIMLGILSLAESRAKSQIEKPLDVPMVGAERAPNMVAWLAGQGIHRKAFQGDLDAAVEHYRAAANRTTSIPERDYLLTQAARLAARTGSIEPNTPAHDADA